MCFKAQNPKEIAFLSLGERRIFPQTTSKHREERAWGGTFCVKFCWEEKSFETLLKTYGIYHLSRLKADKNLKDLADAFEIAQKRLKEKIGAVDAAEGIR